MKELREFVLFDASSFVYNLIGLGIFRFIWKSLNDIIKETYI